MAAIANFHEVVLQSSADEATWTASGLVKDVINRAVSERGKCHVALAGGTTPHGLYLMLAGAALSGEVPWHDVVAFFGDERDVPHDDADSNYRMAQRTLLDHVPVEPGSIHPMPADAADLDAAAQGYEDTIRRIVPAGDDTLPKFDLILLGMGNDGHTASLFPDAAVLNETNRLVVAYRVPILDRNRMTFTLPLINAARDVIMLVTGVDKAAAVSKLLDPATGPDHSLPASLLKPTDGRLTLVLDRAAARDAQTV